VKRAGFKLPNPGPPRPKPPAPPPALFDSPPISVPARLAQSNIGLGLRPCIGKNHGSVCLKAPPNAVASEQLRRDTAPPPPSRISPKPAFVPPTPSRMSPTMISASTRPDRTKCLGGHRSNGAVAVFDRTQAHALRTGSAATERVRGLVLPEHSLVEASSRISPSPSPPRPHPPSPQPSSSFPKLATSRSLHISSQLDGAIPHRESAPPLPPPYPPQSNWGGAVAPGSLASLAQPLTRRPLSAHLGATGNQLTSKPPPTAPPPPRVLVSAMSCDEQNEAVFAVVAGAPTFLISCRSSLSLTCLRVLRLI